MSMLTTIRTYRIRRGKMPHSTIPEGSEAHYGVAVRGGAGSIVQVVTTKQGRNIVSQTVTGIERLPFDVATMVRRLRQLREDDPLSRIVIDADQLGAAVWTSLNPRTRASVYRNWIRYDKIGPDRFALITKLLVAEADGTFTFAGRLRERDAMVRALAQAKRDVAKGSDPGSDLVVSLALALADRRPPRPRIY